MQHSINISAGESIEVDTVVSGMKAEAMAASHRYYRGSIGIQPNFQT
jgi:hypothetical protein